MEYDMGGIHKYLTNTFPRTKPIMATNPTKMNVIVPVIREPARDIMDFMLLTVGANLNILLGLVITLNPSMHASANCYIMSLVCSNLVILLEPLQQVLRWIFDVKLKMNLDYIFLITFDTSILTITILNLEVYVVICQKSSPLRTSLLKISTAVKGILFIWIMCIMMTALELHMYGHFSEEVVYDICVSSTVMFLVFPCFIFVMLDCFILYDLIILKSIDGMWPSADIERFILLAGITIGFFLTVIPYRGVRGLSLIALIPDVDTIVEVVYTMLKTWPIILPIICFATSMKFRQAFKTTLRC